MFCMCSKTSAVAPGDELFAIANWLRTGYERFLIDAVNTKFQCRRAEALRICPIQYIVA
jgi:hypothetical protein